jgi:ankyrin repeat protein
MILVRFRKLRKAMSIKTFFGKLATISLITLALSIPAFCGEIHYPAGAGDPQVKVLLPPSDPMNVAAMSGDLTKIKALIIENSSLVSSRDINNGWTPLHWAAWNGHKDVAELLLSKGANGNAMANDGFTPLHVAAQNGQKDVAELLLANKANVNAKTKEGWTPLHLATGNGHKDLVKLLRQHGGHE